MIIAKNPLRITFGGGGTDFQSYFSRNGGLCLSACIDKYVYCVANHTYEGNFIASYSKYENERESSEIRHPIVHAVLNSIRQSTKGVELHFLSDVPDNGTGLGSSSAFTCSMIKALEHLDGVFCSVDAEKRVAKLAIEVELGILGEPIGWQDQIATAYGGVQKIEFEVKLQKYLN